MNKETRPPKQDDQENVEKAFQYIIALYAKHPEIEPTLWASALWSALTHGYINCEYSHSDFALEIQTMVEHSKQWFDE